MTHKDPRIATMNAILNNKDLLSILSDAWGSPLGSTKRIKARSIIGSFNKYNGIMDGQGGAFNTPTSGNLDWAKIPVNPTMEMGTPATPPASMLPETTTSKKGTVFMAAAPALRTSITTPQTITNASKIAKSFYRKGIDIYDASTNQRIGSTDAESPNAESPNIPSASATQPVGTLTPATSTEQPMTDIEKMIQDEINSGVGMKAFNLTIFTDREKFHKLFPDYPIDQLPVGATYLEQFDDIEKNLRDDYKLDTLEGNMTRLQNAGVNIEGDLNSYMIGRDKYIERLDNMIDLADDKMKGMDLSNPDTQKILGNYKNYLYIMKGRQQKRYADFITQAVNQYEAELKNSQDVYDTTYKAFTSALSQKEDIAKADYENFSKMIDEMYTNVKNREKTIYTQLDLQDKTAKLLKDQAQNALDAARGIGGIGVGSTMTASQNNTAYSKFANASQNKGKSDDDISNEWNNLSSAGKMKWLTYAEKSTSGNPFE